MKRLRTPPRTCAAAILVGFILCCSQAAAEPANMMPEWLVEGGYGVAVEPSEDRSWSSERTLDAAVGTSPWQPTVPQDVWEWRLLPDGLMYPAYLAGGRESRFATHWVDGGELGPLWDVTLGGRVGILRFGSPGPIRPEGWQIDVEGAAFPRLALDYDRDLLGVDFRFGVPLTLRRGPLEVKLAYFHLSSHMGDELLLKDPDAVRINYVRDALVLGLSVYPRHNLRLYGEAGWAFYIDGGARPWEFQVGVDMAPTHPTGFRGAPFVAVNGRLRQENDFGGNLTVQAGWMWRSEAGRTLRGGFHFFQGQAEQFQWFERHERLVGGGLWYDF